ncbi:MAG: alpha-amylase family protein [Acidobacteriota bacterium]
MFLKQAAALSASSALSLRVPASAERVQGTAQGVGAAQPGWFQKPMRWAQLSFVESDPGNYDPAFWLDFFKKIHAEATILNAGGCVAFYPTQIPFHYRSQWLGNRDAFGHLAGACRDMGMIVVARTDAHACHGDLAQAHPDWLMVGEDGKTRRHPSDPDFWLTCALGPYNFEFMTSVHQEIMTRYQVSGIFTNRWAGSGMCYCEHCQANFRTWSGLDLPRTSDPQDPSRQKYILWHQQRLFELWNLWDAKISAINPDARFIPNTGGGALSDLDMKKIGEMASTLVADRQGRTGIMAPWANGKSAKEFRSTMGNKAVTGIFSVGIEDKHRWKDSVQSGDEIRLWVADGIAHGFRPTCTKFNARPFDDRWFPVVEEMFQWHYANEKYLRNQQSFARVGMVYSQQTAAFYGGPDAATTVDAPGLGFYQALIEARIPFQMVHDHLLDADHLQSLRTLILPNIAALSQEQCAQLQAFVQRGGSVIATYETSLYDEWGVRRQDFGLRSLFGVSWAGRKEGPMLNSYLQLQKDPATGQYHPLLRGFEDTTRIINGVYRLHVNQDPGATSTPLLVIPPYPDLPMEECFPRPTQSHEPGVVVRTAGKGRVIYFPWDVDRTFWEVLNVDHARLLRNAVAWATDEPDTLTVEGKGILDISLWGQKDSFTVHLVNLTNPMMMRGPLREVIPLPNQTVRLRPPTRRAITGVRLLVAGQAAQYRREGETIVVHVPSIDVHEVVAFDLAPEGNAA